ncbi:MAG: hypothetical protein HQL14_07825 [Candidatus Omnitrophica bacterium]|nr:hypothetical protein [Candidatus Omnitrophota bacterium]
MNKKDKKLLFVASFDDASILRKFTILFLVASILPMVLLYYIYAQNSRHGHIGINPANFTIAMVLMVLGVFVGFISMHSLLKKVVNISKENSKALGNILSPDTVKELNQGENEIVILSRSFSAVTQQLEEKNKKLRSMYELQKDFTSMVSHELRTPLASIKMAVELVAEEAVGEINIEQKEILGRAQQEADRLKRLIDDILYLSKIEADKLQMNFMIDDLHRVMTPIVESQKYVAQSRGLYLKTEFDPGVPQLSFDRDRIIQVLNNLLSNAIKFTKEGGITVKTLNKISENCVVVSVVDTGRGISQEDLPKLFGKFQQIDSAQENVDGGTGLGLAISREIITRHSGKIWVESKLGVGTAFNFTLPIKEIKSAKISSFSPYSSTQKRGQDA